MTNTTTEEQDVNTSQDGAGADLGVSDPEHEQTSTGAASEPPQGAESTEDDGNAEPEAETDTPNREAARYRRRLRETEAERDALAARVESLQRAEAERLAGSALTKPAALWAAGVELSDLLDADGIVSPSAVAEAAAQARDALGLAPARPRGHVASEGGNPRVGEGSSGMLAALMRTSN